MESSNLNNYFLPRDYVGSISQEERTQTLNKSQEDIKDIIRTADHIKKQVILQDLIAAGKKDNKYIQSKEGSGINAAVLAAEAFVKLPLETQKEFLKHIKRGSVPEDEELEDYEIDLGLCRQFRDAMVSNALYHQVTKPPDFTEKELAIEGRVAQDLNKYVRSVLGE